MTAELPAHTARFIGKNWFTDDATDTESTGSWAYAGIWDLSFGSVNRRTAQLEITQWGRRHEHSVGWIDAELAVLGVSNRYFSGRFEGSRLWMASFDDAVPCLITVTMQADGTITGELTRSDGPVQSFEATLAQP